MSFYFDKNSENSLIYNFDDTFDNNLYLEKIFNSSYNSSNNIFDTEKMNNCLNPSYKENENNINIYKEKNFVSPSGLNQKEPIKKINEELNGQLFEESTTKTLHEICITNNDLIDLDCYNSSYKSKTESTSKNKDEKTNMILNKNAILKSKIKNDKNSSNLTPKISAINYLSEKALKYYLKKGQGQDVEEFFNNYLKDKSDQKKNLLKMILSSHEFISKIYKYKHKKKETSFFLNEQNFLKKKHYLNRDDSNKKEKNAKIQNYFKTPNLNIDYLKSKNPIFVEKEKKFNLCHINRFENNIKIMNNKIIDIKNDKSMGFNSQNSINYEDIFVNQFINKYSKIKKE